MRQHRTIHKGTWQPPPCAATVTNPVGQQPTPTHCCHIQEVANKSRTFTQRAAHHHATPQQVGEAPREELVEDKLEESETEGLIGTPEIIGPSPETFAQLFPSTQPSIIPCLSPSQGQAPLQPSTPQPPKFPPTSSSSKCGPNGVTPSTCLSKSMPFLGP